jgi:hypothetical protein
MYEVKVFCTDAYMDDGSFTTITEGLFSTKANATAALATWCRGQWVGQDHMLDEYGDEDDPERVSLPEGDEATIEAYFKFWNPEEQYSIKEVPLDAPLT